MNEEKNLSQVCAQQKATDREIQENPELARQMKTIRFTLNGRPRQLTVDMRLSLLEMLRNDCGMTSVKRGCEVGECGACTVLINDEPFDSCIYLAIWADGKDLTTLEGLEGPHGELSDLQQAFVDEAALQCGYCTPGFIMAAEAIFRAGKRLSSDEIRRQIAGNLCRCTGYVNIIKAIEKVMDQRFGPA